MKIGSPEEFVGGHPALDFLNTVEDTGKSRLHSKIADWQNFVSWCETSKLYSPVQIENLLGTTNSEAQIILLDKIQTFREKAYDAVAAIANKKEDTQPSFARLQEDLLAAMRRATLSVENGRTRWQVTSDNPHWREDVLVLALEDLLRSDDFQRLRQCGRCTWLFLDKGRGRGRRWCRMSKCGNREKTKRFRSH